MPTNRREYNSNREVSIRGGYVPFTLTRNPNLETYEKVVSTLNEQQLKTAEQRAKIAGAIAQTELHHSEDGYKQKLIEYYNGEISKDPFNYIKAQELGGKAASDPELLAKIRTNQEYKEFTETVKQYKDSGKINGITAERLLQEEGNQYRFKPQVDANGKIVGGEKWTAEKMPVQSVDRTQIAALARQLAAPLKGSTDVQRASSVTNADGTGKGSSTQKGLQWDRLPADKIKQVFEGVFAQMPGAEQSLMQDYEDDIYLLQKLDKEFKATQDGTKKTQLGNQIDRVKDRLYDGATLRTPTSYMAKSMNLIIDNMAYDYEYSTDHSSSTIDNNAKGGSGGSGGGAGVGAGLAGISMPWGMMDWFGGTTMGGTVMANSGYYTAPITGIYDGLNSLLESAQTGGLGNVKSKNTGIRIGF